MAFCGPQHEPSPKQPWLKPCNKSKKEPGVYSGLIIQLTTRGALASWDRSQIYWEVVSMATSCCFLFDALRNR